MRDVQEAAHAKRVQVDLVKARSESEIYAAFASLVQRQVDALVVASDPFIASRREQFVALAARHAVPAIYEFREYATAGGLISCGVSLKGAYREVGIDAGKILKGAKPADLPVVQPTTFELVVNMDCKDARSHSAARVDRPRRRGDRIRRERRAEVSKRENGV